MTQQDSGPEATPDSAPATVDEMLRAELAQLREEITSLQTRVEALEQPAAETPTPAAPAIG